MFATLRRKQRSTNMKNELGQGVDHFKRAASLAAQETSATVKPKLSAAKDRVQPAASKAKDAASGSWESAVASITPLVAAANDNLRSAGKVTKKQAKANKKKAQKNAVRLDRLSRKATGRQTKGRKGGRLLGFALVGTALGAGAAYVVRKRKAAQWDEYDPSGPLTTPVPAATTPVPVSVTAPAPAATTTTFGTPVTKADDVVIEPATPAKPYGETDVAPDATTDQTSSALHSPKVARLASGKNKD